MSKPTAQLIRLVVLVAIIAFVRFTISASASDQFSLKVPVGIQPELWSYFIPKDNPLTLTKVELGRRLFFEKRLSADASVSCGSCHDPALAFTDGRKIAEGIDGRRGTRNTPTLLNAMFNSSMFWDGRADSLEEQARQPLINADEMGNLSHEQVLKRIAAIPEYTEQFQRVFGGPVTIDALARAIASYERTLVSANSRFDRFLEGDRSAMNESAQRGFSLFRTKARCTICHNLNQSFPFLTDGNYRNTGIAANFSGFDALSRRATAGRLDGAAMTTLKSQPGHSELGRFLSTGSALDIGAFRTPSLRNVELTAPYFHDGSAATLADVVRYYVRGGNANSSRDWELQPVDLTEREQQDLIEFLKSLTSDDARPTGKN